MACMCERQLSAWSSDHRGWSCAPELRGEAGALPNNITAKADLTEAIFLVYIWSRYLLRILTRGGRANFDGMSLCGKRALYWPPIFFN